jgi:hypothetical protein
MRVYPKLHQNRRGTFFARFEFSHNPRRLLVTANAIPNSPVLVILMMEVISSSEMSVVKKGPRCKIPEDGILHSHRRKNLNTYIALTGWAL